MMEHFLKAVSWCSAGVLLLENAPRAGGLAVELAVYALGLGMILNGMGGRRR